MNTTQRVLIAACIAMAALALGCSAAKHVTPLKTTFLEGVNLDAKKENLPFDHSQVRRGAQKSAYKYVYYKPVRIDLLDKSAWTNSASVLITSEEQYMAHAAQIAQYFHEQLVEETRNSKEQRLQLVGSPQPDALIIEIALTELEFSHPLARAGALAVPVPGTGAAVAAVSDPHVSFAARITDSDTGKIVATAADRKFSPLRIIDLNKFTVSSAPREIVALWAKEIAEAVQGDGFTKVSEKKWSLLPW